MVTHDHPARQAKTVASKVFGQDVGDPGHDRVLLRGLLGPTKTKGVGDVDKYVSEHTLDYGYETAIAPLIVSSTELEVHRYYFWFFGYVAKLPYERTLISPFEQSGGPRPMRNNGKSGDR